MASLAGLFGIVALLLAAIGLYGVTAYTVAQRTNEIGIRMALGADRARVAQLVLRGAFQRVLIGLIVGVPLAVGAGRLIATQLYGVSFWDPIALGVARLARALRLIAAIVPAGRAAAISPIRALHRTSVRPARDRAAGLLLRDCRGAGPQPLDLGRFASVFATPWRRAPARPACRYPCPDPERGGESEKARPLPGSRSSASRISRSAVDVIAQTSATFSDPSTTGRG